MITAFMDCRHPCLLCRADVACRFIRLFTRVLHPVSDKEASTRGRDDSRLSALGSTGGASADVIRNAVHKTINGLPAKLLPTPSCRSLDEDSRAAVRLRLRRRWRIKESSMLGSAEFQIRSSYQMGSDGVEQYALMPEPQGGKGSALIHFRRQVWPSAQAALMRELGLYPHQTSTRAREFASCPMC